MIRYSKSYWGALTLVRWYGSAFPRALPFSLLSAAAAGLLRQFWASQASDLWLHPYPFQTFAFIVGFMIVFRSNLSYGRYMEGRTALQTFTSKLSDLTMQALAFDYQTLKEPVTSEALDAHRKFANNFVHLVSLMHGVALATLRDDFDMENVMLHDSLAKAPPSALNARRESDDSADGDSDDAFSVASSGAAKGGGARRRGYRRGRRRAATPPPHAPAHVHVSANAEHTAKTAPTPAFLVASGYFSFFDFFVLRTDYRFARRIYQHMKLPIVGGLTQAEGVALGAFSTSGQDSAQDEPNFNLGAHGILLENGLYAPAPFERVHTICSWLHNYILERSRQGGLAVSPPVLARLPAVLSDAMLGYEQCRKLVDTPFPFPWAQCVTIVLVTYTAFTPFLIAGFTTSTALAVLMTFASVHTMIMLNEVARDIEDPFHYDPNELPLPQIQYRLNERLLSVAKSSRPVAFTDIADLGGPGNVPTAKGATAASSPAASPAAHAAPTSPAATVPPALSATQSMLPDAACVAANATDDDFLEYSASNSAPPRSRHSGLFARRRGGGRGAAPSPRLVRIDSHGSPSAYSGSATFRQARAAIVRQRSLARGYGATVPRSGGGGVGAITNLSYTLPSQESAPAAHSVFAQQQPPGPVGGAESGFSGPPP